MAEAIPLTLANSLLVDAIKKTSSAVLERVKTRLSKSGIRLVDRRTADPAFQKIAQYAQQSVEREQLRLITDEVTELLRQAQAAGDKDQAERLSICLNELEDIRLELKEAMKDAAGTTKIAGKALAKAEKHVLGEGGILQTARQRPITLVQETAEEQKAVRSAQEATSNANNQNELLAATGLSLAFAHRMDNKLNKTMLLAACGIRQSASPTWIQTAMMAAFVGALVGVAVAQHHHHRG